LIQSIIGSNEKWNQKRKVIQAIVLAAAAAIIIATIVVFPYIYQ
jgi:hypothetical protein